MLNPKTVTYIWTGDQSFIVWDIKKLAFYINNKVYNPLNKKNIRFPSS